MFFSLRTVLVWGVAASCLLWMLAVFDRLPIGGHLMAPWVWVLFFLAVKQIDLIYPRARLRRRPDLEERLREIAPDFGYSYPKVWDGYDSIEGVQGLYSVDAGILLTRGAAESSERVRDFVLAHELAYAEQAARRWLFITELGLVAVLVGTAVMPMATKLLPGLGIVLAVSSIPLLIGALVGKVGTRWKSLNAQRELEADRRAIEWTRDPEGAAEALQIVFARVTERECRALGYPTLTDRLTHVQAPESVKLAGGGPGSEPAR